MSKRQLINDLVRLEKKALEIEEYWQLQDDDIMQLLIKSIRDRIQRTEIEALIEKELKHDTRNKNN